MIRRRPPPRYQADEVIANVVLNPSGNHRLEVTTTGGICIASYSAGAVQKIETAIDSFNRLTASAHGGSDLQNTKTIAVELK